MKMDNNQKFEKKQKIIALYQDIHNKADIQMEIKKDNGRLIQIYIKFRLLYIEEKETIMIEDQSLDNGLKFMINFGSQILIQRKIKSGRWNALFTAHLQNRNGIKFKKWIDLYENNLNNPFMLVYIKMESKYENKNRQNICLLLNQKYIYIQLIIIYILFEVTNLNNQGYIDRISIKINLRISY
ncbi:unnamed protein product [Paramecium pentaurelia]|uniref:Transmembrane protein n=1 Tax=Paramecium pentaurelia TaxID=43138 RepID=A0A8S1X631_9CILI|nr:unnamed protein product [Paramecium pentaurelia]